MSRLSFYGLLGVLFFMALPASAASDSKKEAAPLPYQEKAMTQDELVNFFESLKKGTPVEISLGKGKVVKGLYSSYDDYYDSVWIIPQAREQGMFKEKSVKLAGIKSAVFWDKKAEDANASESSINGNTSPGGDDYYLLKESGYK